MARAPLTTLVLAFVLGASSTARAAAASRLVYSRTPGAARCPDEHGFRAAVVERLGYDPFFPFAEQTVTVDLFEEKGALRGRLSLIDRDGIVRGIRELKGVARDCEDLLASLALATSITLDPMAAQTGGVPPPQPQPDRSAPAVSSSASLPPPPSSSSPAGALEQAPPRDESSSPDARTEVTARTRWSLLAGPVIALGEMPGTSMGGRLGAELRHGHWALAAELRGALPTRISSDAGGTAHVGVVGGTVAPCFTEGPWSACGIVYLGSMNARGSDVEVPLQASLFFASAGARAQMAIPLVRPVDLRIHLDGMKTLILSHLYLHGREVWQTPPFWAALGISASFLFP